ncbi:hypothetical protein ES703_27616 [subsurface metagenome]
MRKATIRRMTPEARKLARLINDLDSVKRRLKNFLPVVSELELWAESAKNQQRSQVDLPSNGKLIVRKKKALR